ncbi:MULTISPECIES: CAP domain-containing protein [Pontibacillus]|uniref:CAP domain-containing protein n=1 Tax=Pontibacillus chungwhensis TaxID=265426 RepID=A0ABY8UZF8_9BACI|nr:MULTISPECIES: CAP domain-containing protein [Pontibacillus]MCD5325449.1 CAP domain-containing protein [Pontibacillus sp. HN14]WIF98563.1 CAP domain-containing protein [Pontibacillus chungwhensis]
MFKKVTITTALASTLMAGGVMQSDVHAQSQDSIQTKTFKFESGQQFNQEQINQYINKYLSNYEIKWDQAKQEQPKSDQEAPQTQQKAPERVEQQAPTSQQQEPAQAKEQTTEQQTNALSQFEQKVVELTNEERAAQGLDPLKIDKELSNVAEKKSQDMAQNGYFSHNSPTYGSPFDMMKQFGIEYRTAGENIAKGQQTPQEVVDAWMNSEGHRANILNENFTHIGVGFVEDGNVWTQQFIGK